MRLPFSNLLQDTGYFLKFMRKSPMYLECTCYICNDQDAVNIHVNVGIITVLIFLKIGTDLCRLFEFSKCFGYLLTFKFHVLVACFKSYIGLFKRRDLSSSLFVIQLCG